MTSKLIKQIALGVTVAITVPIAVILWMKGVQVFFEWLF